MKSLVIKDIKRRQLYNRYEIRKKLLKSLICSNNLKRSEKYYILSLLSKYPRDSSLVKVRNRCILTGRGRGILSKYSLSRIMFKKHANLGYLSWFRKK